MKLISNLSLFFLLVILISCSSEKKEGEQPKVDGAETLQLMQKAKQMFGLLPDKMPGSEKDTPELIALGKKLYFENSLSANNSESCNTCHNIEGKNAGVDNKPVSPGAFGKSGTRNSPTVYNAGFHFVQFWDGRAKDLKEQAKGPILNPIEMAMKSEKDVVKVISAVQEYKEMFAKAFPGVKDPITYDNIAEAIAAFERTLISRPRFEDFIKGNMTALNAAEIDGLKKFMDVGCTTCHMGPLLGGTMYQKMGLVNPYENTTDLGRYEVTKAESDKFMFKVPSLTNVALTYPYFHDGAVADLGQAVEKMAWLELGKKLTKDETDAIVAFLKTLNGKNLQ